MTGACTVESASGRAFCLAALVFAAPLLATAQQSDQETSETLEEVVVTGSRIPRRDFTSPSPITTIDDVELKLSGTTNVVDALDALPQVVPGFNRSANNPGNGTATVNLRGLGVSRTLILLNGRRFISTSNDGAVDTNNIPAGLVKRIEVVSGGASAVYGSDALAGAINFILKDNFEGIEASAQYDVTEQNDGQVLDLSIAGGMPFGVGRGHLSGFIDYNDRKSIFQGDRPFSAQTLFVDLFTGEIFVGGSTRTPEGQIPNSVDINGVPAPDGITFNQDGTPRPFDDQNDRYDFGPANYLQTPLTRWSVAGFADFDLSNSMRAYLELMYVENDAAQELAPTLSFFFVQMNLDNPFVTPETRQVLENFFDPDADGIADFIFNKRFLELGPRHIDTHSEMQRIVGGINGELGNDWSWDVHYIDAGVDFSESLLNDGSARKFLQSLLVDPLTGQCMDTSEGCVPANIFGAGNISPEAAAFIRVPPLQNEIRNRQQIAGASLVGDLMALPGGDLAFALGAEWRNESASFRPDPALFTGDLMGYDSLQPVDGEITIKEVFGELLLPILSDVYLARYLGLEAAYRYSDHSTAGGYSTWKLAGEWEPFSGVRFRGSVQQAVRAPNVEELFEGQSTGINPFIAEFADLCSASFNPDALGIDDVCVAQGVPRSQIGVYQAAPFFPTETTSGGNLDLEPEISDTVTAGIVLQPEWLPSINVSLDYYSIQIDNAIQFVGAFDTVLLCFTVNDPNDPLCQAVERGDTTFNITSSTGGPRNIARIKTDGIDLQINYVAELPSWLSIFNEGATFDIWFLGNHVLEHGTQTTPDVEFTDCAGLVGFPCDINSFGTLPAYRTTTRFTYNSGPLAVSVQWRWIDGMDSAFLEHGLELFGIPRDAVSFDIPSPSSENYFALSFDYQINDRIGIYGGVRNLTNNAPPPLFDTSTQANTDPSIYDVYGRRYFMGVTARF